MAENGERWNHLGGPRLELDELLAQLIDRAHDVMASQGRLRGLFRATQSIIAEIELPIVLRRIVEAACELLDAQYGALGVIQADGHGLEEFIHVGLDQETVARIGHLPQGKGLLGALIDDPRPIKLRDIRDDPRSAGFPLHHPPMSGFLGVPIEVRGEVFGNLYLTEPRKGEFSAEDEDLAKALAATAGLAIENARLYADAQERQRWLQGSTELTHDLMSGSPTDSLRLVAQRLLELSESDLVSVVLPSAELGQLDVVVAVGLGAEQLEGTTHAARGTLTDEVMGTGSPLLVEDAARTFDAQGLTPPGASVLGLGPVLVLPLLGAGRPRGALVVGRAPGGRPFTAELAESATVFAGHAAVALELAEGQKNQQRMALLEDRARIARDLHDHVIQQLFAAGMTIQGVIPGLGDSPNGNTLEGVVDRIDEAIKQIRTSIFQLRPHTLSSGSLRSAVLEVVAEVTPALGFAPLVHFSGPVDAVSDDEIAGDVTAVVREALTNAAKHAEARRVEVQVQTTNAQLVVLVEDDGVGLRSMDRRSGLDNLRLRAEARSGSLLVEPAKSGRGTCVSWAVALG